MGSLAEDASLSTRWIENFGGNVRFTPAAVYTPRTEQEVLTILNQHRGQPIRAAGRLHSWSTAVQTEGVLLDLRELCSVRVEEIEGGARAIVGAGCQIKQLLKELKAQGDWTLPSMGLITEQAIAGAVSTGTHGSGKNSISHYVQAVRIACYDRATGQAVIREVTSGDELRAARCSLGCLGIILSLTLECRRPYLIEEHFRLYARLGDVLEAEKDSPLQQFFLVPWVWNFLVQHRRESAASRSRLARLYRWYWFLGIDLGLHLLLFSTVRILKSPRLARFLYRHVIPRLVVRRWRVTDDSTSQLVMEHELFRHIEMELFVKGAVLEEALNFLQAVLVYAAGETSAVPELLEEQVHEEEERSRLRELAGCYGHHYPICVRRILADDTLISMASGGTEPCYSISLISYEHVSRREGFFQVMGFLASAMAARFGARPHWGKLCPIDASRVVALYENFETFQRICEDFDPEGVFRNAWTAELLTVSVRDPVIGAEDRRRGEGDKNRGEKSDLR